MTILTNIKEFTQEWKTDIKNRVAALRHVPTIGIVRIGNNPASERYVRNKIKDCQEVGIPATEYHYDTITQEEFALLCGRVQLENDFIIVQQPLPDNLILDEYMINSEQDIDAFLGANSAFDACTPFGIMYYLRKSVGWQPEGKEVCIIGRGNLVGKPLARMMTDANATVTLCHSKSRNLLRHMIDSNLIVSAVGKANFIDAHAVNALNPGVMIIDVGINFDENGKMVGDCYNVTPECNVTPVPGGVGLLTRCAIMEQAVKMAATW